VWIFVFKQKSRFYKDPISIPQPQTWPKLFKSSEEWPSNLIINLDIFVADFQDPLKVPSFPVPSPIW
jgi:hypothetical protein